MYNKYVNEGSMERGYVCEEMFDGGIELWVVSVVELRGLLNRGTRRRCSAKYLFRSGNSAGWEINYCYKFQLGISHFFKRFEPRWLDFPKD